MCLRCECVKTAAISCEIMEVPEQCNDQPGVARIWWKLRTRLERRLLIITIVALLTLFAVITNVFYIHIKSKQVTPVCMSADCVQTAAKFLNAIDPTADPCEDFGRFACGNFFADSHPNATTSELVRSEISARRRFEHVFLAKTSIATTLGGGGGASQAIRVLRHLYATCMNRSAIDDGVAHLKRELIVPLGGWPLISHNWDEAAFTGHSGALNFNWIWLSLLRPLHGLGFRADMFFAVRVHANYTDGNNYLRIIPPTLGDGIMSRDFRKRNEAFLLRTLEAFGGDRTRAAYDINYLGDFTLEFIKVVSRSNNMSLEGGPRSDIDIEPTLITLGELESVTQSAQIEWTQMFVTLTGNVRHFNAQTYVIFDTIMLDYMRDLQALLKKTPRRVLANYIIWEVLKDMQMWYNVPTQPRITVHERKHLCIDEVNKLMPLIANQELAKTNQHRDVIKQMIVDIRDEIILKVQGMKWLNTEMKTFLVRKLENVKYFIGGQLEDNKDLKIDYIHEDWHKNDNYIQTITKVKSAADRYLYKVLLNKSTMETTFIHLLGMDANANAYYLPNNYVAIPTGLIHEMFSKTLPDYINYARMGHFIGHELSHVLSTSAQKYGLNGEKNPLHRNILSNYTNQFHCRTEEYQKYILGKYGVLVNGSTTLDENMADLIGTHAAYEVAYRLNQENPSKSINLPAIHRFTSRQLFWITFAVYYCDPQEATHLFAQDKHETGHGVGSFRIFSTLRKSQRFAVDFKCGKGKRMNPVRKCVF